MILQCKKNELSSVVQEMISVIPSSSLVPILNCFLFSVKNSEIIITASDLEISLTSHVKCVSDEEISIAIPAKLFTDIVKNLDEATIKLEFNDLHLTIHGSTNYFSINCIGPEEFPILPSVQGTEYEMSIDHFLSLYTKVSPVVPQKAEGNLNLHCIPFQSDGNEIRMIASDAQRLVVAKSQEETDFGSIRILALPKVFKILSRIISKSKAETMKMTVSEREIMFTFDNQVLISRLVDSNFPDYTKVIPKEASYKFVVDRDKLIHALQRLYLVVRSNTGRINMKLEENSILLTASDPEVGSGKEEVPIEYSERSAEACEVLFDARYMIEGIEGVQKNLVEYQLQGSIHPLVIKEPDSDNYQYVLVTIRMK
ncbi:MAG: DNA polymerase III subunit beta [Caldisericia bacterium]|nr:DNA polymerase III subunit beta [Caldisericia bacterium]